MIDAAPSERGRALAAKQMAAAPNNRGIKGALRRASRVFTSKEAKVGSASAAVEISVQPRILDQIPSGGQYTLLHCLPQAAETGQLDKKTVKQFLAALLAVDEVTHSLFESALPHPSERNMRTDPTSPAP